MRPMLTTLTSSPYFSPKSARAPSVRASSRLMSRVETSAFSNTMRLAISSTAAISSGLIAFGWAKSKRSRSGATSEPFCATWSPRTSRRASCRMWVAEWLARVDDRGAETGRGDLANVADLTAGFAIEGRLVENEPALLTRPEGVDLGAVLDDRADDSLGRLGVIAEKVRRPDPFAQAEPDGFRGGFARARPGASGFRALPLHRRAEAVEVDRKPARTQRVLGQIERKAISVVEAKGRLAGEHAARRQRLRLLLQDRKAARERGAKARLLELHALGDQRLGANEFRIGLAHLAGERRDETPHERVPRAEQLGVAHGAAHDAPEHIAAPLVRGQNAVRDQKGRGAQMVRDDAVRGALRPVRIDAGEVGARADERPEKVDVVIVVHALKHGGDALKPHAGVA